MNTLTKLNLPPLIQPFIGRQKELQEISDLLLSPDCRLITVVGPGGVGKTSLAVELAHQHLDFFRDGVYFVPLQAIDIIQFLMPSIADALHIPSGGTESPAIQVLYFLQDKEILLVLDNFEHLLAGAEQISAILQAAPRTRILITSREVLNLREEWLFPLNGLPFPAGEAESVQEYEAVQLFIRCAQQVQRQFSPEDERANVIRICRLLEGMPLAIELATSWLKVVSCEVIAGEIQKNLDFLQTDIRNIPERHRSMRAVFDQSWKLMSEQERLIFMRLSVFRGGFHRKAAETIADASLMVLSALADKSLLRVDSDGRYQIHGLLRQYGVEKLAGLSEEASRIYDRHRRYYVDFLKERKEAIFDENQKITLREIASEISNVRAAWQSIIEHTDTEDLQAAVTVFSTFCDLQGRYIEAVDALETAVELLQHDDSAKPMLSLLLSLSGWAYIRLGKFEKMRDVFQRSYTILQELNAPPVAGFGTDPVTGLAMVATVAGNYELALELCQQARQQHLHNQDNFNLLVTDYTMASAALAKGDYDTALNYAQGGYDLTQKTRNHWMMAYLLGIMGSINRARGKYDQAREYYQQSYDIKAGFDDPEGIAAALNGLAQLDLVEESFSDAARRFEDSRQIYQRIYDLGGLATSLQGLGEVARAGGHFAESGQYLMQALEISAGIQYMPQTYAILVSIARLWQAMTAYEQSAEILALVLDHPGTNQETRKQAQALLEFLQSRMREDDFQNAFARGQRGDLHETVQMMQHRLRLMPTDKAPAQSPEAINQTLIEPLTPRELEILNRIAEGLSNREIAEMLVITIGTVKSYTSQIYDKLGVRSRTQAVALAREIGLIA